MKKTIIALTILFAIAAVAAALVPQYINYQGILRDLSGNLVTGSRTMSFVIWSDATSTAAADNKWQSGDKTVSVSNGLYSVELGPILNPETVFDGNDRWLEITVDGDLLSPRLKINSVAYAIRADSATIATNADYATSAGVAAYAALAGTVSDEAISTAKIQDGAVNGDKLAGNITGNINFNTTGTISANAISINKFMTGGTGDGFCVGTGLVGAVTSFCVVTTEAVTSNSIILLTVGHGADPESGNNTEALKVSDVSDGANFTVKTLDGTNNSGKDIPFGWLIIN